MIIQEEQTFQERSLIATRHHLDNMKKLAERDPSKEELEKMYEYLDFCWVCGKPITFWNRITFNIQHSFEGNAHKRCLKCQTNY